MGIKKTNLEGWIVNDWKKVLLKPNDSMEYAIKVLHEGGYRIALVSDEHRRLLGTVTDGDIRRALIKKLSMKSPVSHIMNSNPLTVDSKFKNSDILSIMSNQGLLHMPVVDKEGILFGLETLQGLVEKPVYDNPILLMAGGFGKRLYPLTEDTPKPLLKVGEKPILEMIIEQFISHGFHNFYISTHFKSEQIKDYFQNGEQYNISINYVHEDFPLGTAGSLGLLPDNMPDLPIIVMNGDLVTNIDFKNLLDFHSDHDSKATMCVREYDYQVPYGVVEIDNYVITKIKEKPVHKFFVNAGIYVLNRNLIDNIDGKSYLDMTDFLCAELSDNEVYAFPIHEYWLDIGQKDEYEKANQEIKTMF
jgi:UDP-2-acetamido-4-(D-alanylamino)-2,4,6-trideoxy-alpha-D-mannopyranose hydrolase